MAAPLLAVLATEDPGQSDENNLQEEDVDFEELLIAPQYGFPLEEHQVESSTDYFEALAILLSEQQAVWNAYLTKKRADVERYQAGASFMQDTELMSRIHETGIPALSRLRSWVRISGAAASKEAHPQLFEEMLATKTSPLSPTLQRSGSSSSSSSSAAPSSSPLLAGADVLPEYQIDLDVQRTFPGHRYFESSAGRAALKQVLLAYSRVDPVIGYCQGMNFLAGSLLLLSKGDADVSFFLFLSLMDIVRSHYATSMVANKAAIRTLDHLMKRHLPRLHQHLLDLAGPTDILALICMPWWLSFLSTTLQLELVFIVWDSVLLEHNTTPIYAACLAIFDMYADDLLASTTDLSSVIEFFREPRWTGFLSGRCAVFVQRFAHYMHELLHRDSDLQAVSTTAFQQIREESEQMAVSRELLQLTRRTKFSRPQLERLVQQFNQLAVDTGDACQEKGITLPVFEEVVARVLPQWKDTEMTHHFFALLDQSGDGVISFRELMVGMSVLYAGTEEEKLELVFQIYDQDGSGSIDEDELFHFVAFVYRASYTKEPDREAVRGLFQALDTNKDGTVSLVEFKQMVKLFPGMLEFFRLENPATADSRKKKGKWFSKFRKQQRATTVIANKSLVIDDLFVSVEDLPQPSSLRRKKKKKKPTQDAPSTVPKHRVPSLREKVSHPEIVAQEAPSPAVARVVHTEQSPLVAPRTPEKGCTACALL